MSGYRIHAVVFFLVFSFGTTAVGGKLGAIRNKTNKARESSVEKTREQETSKPDTAPEKRESKPRENRSRSNRAKLESVRSATRQPNRTSRRPINRGNPNVNHRPRRAARPNRNHRGWNVDFGPSFCGPTTIVEEYHYVAEPVVVAEPIFVPNSVLPPVMPAESTIVMAPAAEIITEDVAIGHRDIDWIDPIQVRFEIDYASDQDDVTRMGFGLLVNATGGLGVDTGVRLFREQDGDDRDHLWIGDFNIVYELFPSEFVRTRAGVGINWLADDLGAEAGLNLTVGTDIFAGPVTFSGELDLGTIGDTDLFHGRLTAALRPGEHLEWFAGYDYLDIGGVEIHGVVAGARFRF